MTTYAVLVILGDVDDPVGAAEKLLAHARPRPLEGIGWILEPDDADPTRARRRARQARYRARRRDANDADARRERRDGRDANDARGAVENHQFGGEDHSLSPLPGEERESDTPKNDANDARRERRDATTRDDATRRDAELDDALEELADLDPTIVAGDDLELVLVDDRYDDQPANPWRIPPRTDAETELGRARIRELKEQLRAARGDAP